MEGQSMKPTSTDQSEAHAGWIRSLDGARTSCRESLAQATVNVADPTRAVWPLTAPTDMGYEQRAAAKAHAALTDYAAHVEPYRNRCFGIWTDEIDASPHEFFEGDTMDVCLDGLPEWTSKLYEVESWEKHELTGRSKETEKKRVLLPVRYVDPLYRKLNECLERLDLAAEIEPPDHQTTASDSWG